jgi:hypothetical protein
MKKKLAICGDSFMAAVDDTQVGHGEHFTEILAKKLDMDLFTLARGACGNNVIRLQIDEVIKESPDLVIIGTTTVDRIEIPVTSNGLNINDTVFSTYDRSKGILNFDYSTLPDISKYFKNFTVDKIKLISLTMSSYVFDAVTRNSILRQNRFYIKNITDEKINAMIQYYLHCYDYGWKQQLDTWIITDGLQRLMDNNINFYIIPIGLSFDEYHMKKFKKNIIDITGSLNPWNHNSHDTLCRFHTTITDQYKLADSWEEKILNDAFL